MKKIYVYLLLTFMLVGIFALTGCNDAGETYNSPVVGTWGWDQGDIWRYQFNPDGTGDRGVVGQDDFREFTWSTRGDILRINLIGELRDNVTRDELWDFVIVDDVLTITSRQLTHIRWSYNRQY